MKKNRNAFFSENNYNYQAFNPINNVPSFQASSNSQFFAGNNQMPILTPFDEINQRLAKIERQINRIEHRLNKLEQSAEISTTDDYDSNSGNMYML